MCILLKFPDKKTVHPRNQSAGDTKVGEILIFNGIRYSRDEDHLPQNQNDQSLPVPPPDCA